MWKPYQQTFHILLHLNPLVQPALGMNLLILHDPITSSSGHLENVGSQSYADLLTVDTLHNIKIKSYPLTLPLISSEKAK